jgi:hypothetical protein
MLNNGKQNSRISRIYSFYYMSEQSSILLKIEVSLTYLFASSCEIKFVDGIFFSRIYNRIAIVDVSETIQEQLIWSLRRLMRWD